MKKQAHKKIINRFSQMFYIYRYDFFALSMMTLIILYYVSVLFQPGHVVFSDIDFPFYSKDYMDEIYGLWNTRWNTVSMLNIPRLFFILPLYLLSGLFEWNGHLFLKGFILELILVSGASMYLLSKRLVSVYTGMSFNLWKINALIFGSVLYALNPWVIYRIQHIYLLTGYSLFPLVILYFFKVFDHKFQRQVIPNYNPYSKKIYRSNIKDIFILAYLITLSSAAIHYFFYSILVLGILFLLLCFKYFFGYIRRGKTIVKNIFKAILKKLTLLAMMTGGLSFYWLSIYVGGVVLDVGASQHNINVIDTYTMFSRHASIDQVLLMMGYWWPMVDLSQLSSLFYIGGTVLLLIILVGVIMNAYKHHIILFLTLLAGIMILISTGVYYPSASGLFLRLAGLPVFGNIFRDPNKMIAITAIAYSVLLVFGLESIYSWTQKYKYKSALNGMIFLMLLLSCYAYLFPVRDIYFERFFQPIEEPKAFSELRHHYEENPTVGERQEAPYALYVPVAEQMLRPITHISTPKWNVPLGYEDSKATGDIHIYNAPIRTVFHHEGNDPSIKYMYDLIQFILDQGRSMELEKVVKAFGVNQLIYHNEYIDQENRQDFNEEVLGLQENLEKTYENGIFKVFDVDASKEIDQFSQRRFITPYGLLKLHSLSQFEEYDPLDLPLIFTSKEEVFNTDSIGQDDIIEVKNMDDLVLSSMPKKYKLYPFNFVDEVNPFIKWSKTYTTFPDWAWFQSKMDVIHPRFEWDHNKGIVLTFASEAFNVKPHEKQNLDGEIVYDFDSLLRADQFFVADNPDLFDVVSNPYNVSENVGVLHGVIQRGDPSFIWQVAKSPVLTAEEKMPYQFKIMVSGRGANQLHMKVRFYDRNKREIGIQYIVGPDQLVNFDTIEFTGEVVSPKDTAFYRIDLLTYQRPEEKIYWWIHDVEIRKFPKYTKPNEILMTKVLEPGSYRVFVKSFDSLGGGRYSLNIKGHDHEIFTKSTQLSGFKWHDLGDFQFDDSNPQIVLKNIEGFNAVSHIAVVPLRAYEREKSKWKSILRNHDKLLILETEMEFEREGNIQSRRLYPELSNGTGTALSQGKVYAEIEIPTSGAYDIIPSVYFPFLNRGHMRMHIQDSTGQTIYSQTIDQRTLTEKKSGVTIDYDPLEAVYPYLTLEQASPYLYKNMSWIESIQLRAGKYRVIMELISENDNYIKASDFKTFDPNSIVVESARRDLAVSDCSTCERITPDMMRHMVRGPGDFYIEYDTTCSCDWYISSSEPIQVQANEEILISFQARSDAIVKRHSKLIFLDEYKQVVDTKFIFEVEEPDKIKWNTYEQLVKVPAGADSVLYQFWARGNKNRAGKLEIKNLKFEKYNEFVLVDKVDIKTAGLSLKKHEGQARVIKNQISEMEFAHRVDGSVNGQTIWNSFLSPHRIWKVNGKASELTLNGVTMGFQVENGKLDGKMTLSDVYRGGLLLHFLTIVGVLLFYMHFRRVK